MTNMFMFVKTMKSSHVEQTTYTCKLVRLIRFRLRSHNNLGSSLAPNVRTLFVDNILILFCKCFLNHKVFSNFNKFPNSFEETYLSYEEKICLINTCYTKLMKKQIVKILLLVVRSFEFFLCCKCLSTDLFTFSQHNIN
jgi:hypothetical protein